MFLFLQRVDIFVSGEQAIALGSDPNPRTTILKNAKWIYSFAVIVLNVTKNCIDDIVYFIIETWAPCLLLGKLKH